MKMKILVIFCLLLQFARVYGDDTLVSSSGDTIHPQIASSIAMTDETLKIWYKESYWQVEVSYIFTNNADEKKETVAFVSMHNKRLSINDKQKDTIRKFETVVNGDVVSAKISRSEEEDYYIYSMIFKKGVNAIRHSYLLDGTTIGDPYSMALSYKLTTGSNWFGPIGHIRIDVFFDNPVFLIEFNQFFNIRGEYRRHISSNINQMGKYCFIRNGALSFEATNYSPTEDIYLHVDPWGHSVIDDTLIANPKITIIDLIYDDFDRRKSDLKNLNNENIRLLINAIYAWNGYVFENKLIQQYFNKFDWYLPKGKKIELNENENKNIDILRKLQK
jgi:hypothetical protein